MAAYKCGYCGKFNEGDIWCSEAHRQLWYEERRVPRLTGMLTPRKRLGPQGRAIGGRRRIQKARPKKS